MDNYEKGKVQNLEDVERKVILSVAQLWDMGHGDLRDRMGWSPTMHKTTKCWD
jgi:hypothetical protein